VAHLFAGSVGAIEQRFCGLVDSLTLRVVSEVPPYLVQNLRCVPKEYCRPG